MRIKIKNKNENLFWSTPENFYKKNIQTPYY